MTKVNYQDPKEDNWYKYHGKTPPERIPHLTDDEREQLMQENLQNHTCNWHQRGNFIICDVADFEHGKNIGPHKMLDIEKTEGSKVVLRDRGPILRD